MVLHPAAPQLADLELLLSVHRLGSLGKAAREHNVSQPAASVRIQAMERRLGLRLLERSPSGSRFTPAGAMIAKWAQTAVDAVSQLMACTAALNDVGAGSLRISACLTMAECLIPRWLTDLGSRYPNIEFCVQANSHEGVLADLRSGKIDLGFLSDPVPDDMHCRVVGCDELVVVVSPDHPWAGRQRPLSLAELSRGRLILREEGFGARATMQQALGASWNDCSALELPSTSAIREAVEVGAGAGVLSAMSIVRDLRDGRVVRVPVADLRMTRRLRAVWDRNSGLIPAARTLLELAVREQRPVAGAVWPAGRDLQQRPSRSGEVHPLPTSQRQAAMPEASAS